MYRNVLGRAKVMLDSIDDVCSILWRIQPGMYFPDTPVMYKMLRNSTPREPSIRAFLTTLLGLCTDVVASIRLPSKVLVQTPSMIVARRVNSPVHDVGRNYNNRKKQKKSPVHPQPEVFKYSSTTKSFVGYTKHARPTDPHFPIEVKWSDVVQRLVTWSHCTPSGPWSTLRATDG